MSFQSDRIKPPHCVPGTRSASSRPPAISSAKCWRLDARPYGGWVTSRSIWIRSWSRICILPDRWSGGRGNWKRCLSATRCARSSAPAAVTARTICCEDRPGEDRGASKDICWLQRHHDPADLVRGSGGIRHFSRSDGDQGFCASTKAVDMASWEAALGGKTRGTIDWRFRSQPLVDGFERRRSVRWMPVDAGGIAGHSVRDSNRRQASCSWRTSRQSPIKLIAC